MKRTSKSDKSERTDQPRWRNTSTSTFRLKSGKDIRLIKPNQVFLASPAEIPEGIRDIIELLDPDPMEEEAKKIRRTEPPEFTVESKGGGWYDVVNSEGKAMNEKALHKTEAEELKAKLEEVEE